MHNMPNTQISFVTLIMFSSHKEQVSRFGKNADPRAVKNKESSVLNKKRALFQKLENKTWHENSQVTHGSMEGDRKTNNEPTGEHRERQD